MSAGAPKLDEDYAEDVASRAKLLGDWEAPERPLREGELADKAALERALLAAVTAAKPTSHAELTLLVVDALARYRWQLQVNLWRAAWNRLVLEKLRDRRWSPRVANNVVRTWLRSLY